MHSELGQTHLPHLRGKDILKNSYTGKKKKRKEEIIKKKMKKMLQVANTVRIRHFEKGR